MSRDVESLLSQGEAFVKRSSSYLLSNLGKIVASITAAVTVLVVFTDISFSGLNAISLTTTIITVLVSSYVIFFSIEDSGERAAKETEEYKAAHRAYSEMRDRVSGDMLPGLRSFLSDYTKAELEFRRNSLLLSYGYTREGYSRYLSGEEVTAQEKRIYRKANRMRPVNITPKLLLSFEKVGGGELSNPEKFKTARLFIKLIPTTLCTLLTVSIALRIKEGLTAEAVAEGILKLSTLPVVAFRGYATGHGYVKGQLVAWQRAKTSLLEAFLKETEEI